MSLFLTICSYAAGISLAALIGLIVAFRLRQAQRKPFGPILKLLFIFTVILLASIISLGIAYQ